ncbi:hypothetical protein [Helicobacter bilis]|uniref:hypothetical protein n=1 Tax=Helicobacter bilis TaxID=37372 RepID=UPI000A715D19|nr:hypothetical protein [Helicobacter bilis]
MGLTPQHDKKKANKDLKPRKQAKNQLFKIDGRLLNVLKRITNGRIKHRRK